MLSLLEKSHLEGQEEGKILQFRQDILTLLKKRFHTIPNFVKARIEAIADEIVLDSIFNEAIFCSSMEEFEKAL